MSFAKQIDRSHDLAGKRIASRCAGGRGIKGRDRGSLSLSTGYLFRPRAAERDIAADIVAQAPVQPTTQPKTVADSPLVKAAQAYGARQ